jgi:hypothetical protein
MEKWKFGAYHHALIYHAMSGAMKPEERAQFDLGDLPRGGDAYTVDAMPACRPAYRQRSSRQCRAAATLTISSAVDLSRSSPIPKIGTIRWD